MPAAARASDEAPGRRTDAGFCVSVLRLNMPRSRWVGQACVMVDTAAAARCGPPHGTLAIINDRFIHGTPALLTTLNPRSSKKTQVDLGDGLVSNLGRT